MNSTGKRLLETFALPVLLVLCWFLLTLNNTNFFVPSPSGLIDATISTWTPQRLLVDVLPSVIRLLVGYFCAAIIGVAAGILIGTVAPLRWLLEPVLEFARAVPPAAIIPIALVLFGLGDEMKIVVIAAGCLWPVLLNTVEGVRSVDPVALETARTYRISGLSRIRHVILPAITPQVMVGLRQSTAVALIMTVVSEMFASSSGLGFLIVYFQRTFAIPSMWSGILLLGLIGVALSLVFQLIEKSVLRWYNDRREIDNAI